MSHHTPRRTIVHPLFTSSPLTPASSPEKQSLYKRKSSKTSEDEYNNWDADTTDDSLQLRPGVNDEYTLRRTEESRQLQHDLDVEEDAGDEEDEDSQKEYEVEAILGKRKSGRTIYYKIRWAMDQNSIRELDSIFRCYQTLTGLQNSNSWEPESNVNAVERLEAFEKNLRSVPTLKKAIEQEMSVPSLDMKMTPKPLKRHQRTFSESENRSARARKRIVKSLSSSGIEHQASSKENTFFKEPYYDVDELIVPMATALCEPAWQQVEVLIEKTALQSPPFRKAIAVHPATLITLRTLGLPSERTFGKLKRQLLKKTISGIEDCKILLLNNPTFPEASSFRHCALSDILEGGEAYRLSWGKGFDGGINDEFGHLVACLQHLSLKFPDTKARMVVRKVKPNLQTACDYFGVKLIDIAGLHGMLRV